MLHQEDNLIKCPYNDAHLIRPKRMQTHLVKCKKSNILLDYVNCPLDATHHLPRKELELHLKTCSKRSVVEGTIYKRTNGEPVVPQLTADELKAILPECEESWDDDCQPTYNPLEQSANRNVVRTLKGAAPAERRAFQRAERIRLSELQEKERREGPVQRVPRSTQMEERPVRQGLGAQLITAVNGRAEDIRMPKRPSQAVLFQSQQMQQQQQSE